MSVRATRWPRAAATVAALLAGVVALVGCTADVDVTVNADGKVDTSLDVRIDADDPNKDLIKELAAGLGQATGAGSNGECTDSTADGVVVIACTTPPFDADIPADETAGIRVTEEDGRVLLRLWSDEEVDGGGWFDTSAVTTNLTITMPGEIDVAEMNGNALDTQGDTVTVSMTGVEPFDVVVTTAATDTPRVTSPATWQVLCSDEVVKRMSELPTHPGPHDSPGVQMVDLVQTIQARCARGAPEVLPRPPSPPRRHHRCRVASTTSRRTYRPRGTIRRSSPPRRRRSSARVAAFRRATRGLDAAPNLTRRR